MAPKPFTFICGSDDFLVGRMGKECFERLAGDAADDFSREIVSGFANNVAEVADAVRQFRDAVQTIPMFGRRYVWLKDVTFLADSVTGRAESTLAQVEILKGILEANNPEQTVIVVTAAPIDRRRTFAKWAEKTGEFTCIAADEGDVSLVAQLAVAEAKKFGLTIDDDALALFCAKLGANTRLALEEINKLAAFIGPEGKIIKEAHVEEMVATVAEGDFFETTDAFFSGDLKRALQSIHQHFFVGNHARPLLVSLQNRNRLLIQVRILLDAGEIRLGQRGIDKAGFDNAARTYGGLFGSSEKSACNVFTQNPWYLGKLANSGKLPTMRRLIDNQNAFYQAFRDILDRPDAQAEIMRDTAVRCLS